MAWLMAGTYVVLLRLRQWHARCISEAKTQQDNKGRWISETETDMRHALQALAKSS
jgi:hypothetical protein